MGEALIGSMAEIAGARWRSEYEQAWSVAFGVVSDAMLEGAQREALAVAA